MQDNENAAFVPDFLIPVGDGFVVPVRVEDAGVLKMKQASPNFSLTEYGVSMSIGQLTMPVSVVALNHLIENGQNVYVYADTGKGYMCEFIGAFPLERDQLLKLLGSWEALYSV
ncbi:hypothetical protein [Geobacter argillaceus]|uniref:hypothetical protein n=1 Tax=Geobacter argillaceus TaxID=345631 RepID=UPI0011A7B465|nr:hypothetical protein [Geobacter argillaceus]